MLVTKEDKVSAVVELFVVLAVNTVAYMDYGIWGMTTSLRGAEVTAYETITGGSARLSQARTVMSWGGTIVSGL